MPTSKVTRSPREVEDAIKALMPIVRREAAARKRKLPANVEFDDLLQAGRMAAWEAVQKFDGRGTLEGLTAQLVRQRMTDYQRATHPAGRNGPALHFVSAEDALDHLSSDENQAQQIEDRNTYESALASIDPRRRRVVERAIAGEPQHEIASSMGVSASRVCQMLQQGVNGKGRNKTPATFDPAAVPLRMGATVPTVANTKRRNRFRELLDRMPAGSSCVLGRVQAASLIAQAKKQKVRCSFRATSETNIEVWREPTAEQLASTVKSKRERTARA